VARATDVRPGREIAELEVAAGRLTPMGHHCKSAADIRLLVARELDLGAVGNGCDGSGLSQAPRTADSIPRSIAQPLDADASRQAARDGGADQLGSKEGKMVMLT